METGALIAALQALAPAATPAALRRVLHALIDDEAIPDTATPPVSSDGAAGRLLDSPDVPGGCTFTLGRAHHAPAF